MRKLLSKIWFPVAVVLFAGLQMFGSELQGLLRGTSDSQSADTVIYNNKRIYTKFRTEGFQASLDSLEGVEEAEDTTPQILARDTIKIPDSLRLTDPFRYRWYISLVDSLTHKETIGICC